MYNNNNLQYLLFFFLKKIKHFKNIYDEINKKKNFFS
jgi:hypothetical protein